MDELERMRLHPPGVGESKSVKKLLQSFNSVPGGHGVPCAEKGQKSFCLNGGICYSIGPNQLCKCIDNYTGQRCEEVLLASVETEPQSNFLFNFLVLGSFLGLIFLGLVVFCCRRKLKNRSEDGP